jgi:hypothetical protein
MGLEIGILRCDWWSPTVSGTVSLLRYSMTSRNTTSEPLAKDDIANHERVG